MLKLVSLLIAVPGLAAIGIVFYAWEIKEPRDWELAFQALAFSFLMAVLGYGLKYLSRSAALTKTSSRKKYSQQPRNGKSRNPKSKIDISGLSNPAQAYKTGAIDLTNGGNVGDAPAGPAFALVVGVCLTRSEGDPGKFQSPPAYEDLTKAEKDAVALIYTCLFGSLKEVNAVLETIIGAKLFEPMFMLFCEAEQYWGLTRSVPDASILQRVISENKKPVHVFNTSNFHGAGGIVACAMQIVEIIVSEGGMPSVEESKTTNTEIKSTEPVTLLRASRFDGSSWEEARSWFGGLPRLGNQAWPRTGKTKTPMAFLTQIDLAHFREIGGSDLLPADGWLAFFLDGDGRECSVLHIEGADLPARTPPPPDAIRDWHWFGRHGVATDFLYGPPTKFELPYFSIDLIKAGLCPNSDIQTAIASINMHAPLQSNGPSKTLVNEATSETAIFFGHTVQHFAAVLRIAAERAGDLVKKKTEYVSEEQRIELEQAEPRFISLCREIDLWSKAIPLYSILTTEDVERLKEYFIKLQANEFDAFMQGNRLLKGDLLLSTYFAFYASSDDVFRLLPKTIQSELSENRRLPAGYWHQMFGAGFDIQGNASFEHANDHMLLQLCYDDIMGWRFGDVGVFQFWISPKNLKKRRWDKVSVTFEGH
ncbi:DUF1963 domain-containing protein [Roseibium sp. MB-4]